MCSLFGMAHSVVCLCYLWMFPLFEYSTKEEALAAFKNRASLGLSIPGGYTYMPTKTMSGGKHWLMQGWGSYGWHGHQCCNKENARYTRCCYPQCRSNEPLFAP